MIFQTVVAGSNAPEPFDVVTWATGTDAQIAAMLKAHYDGRIDIHDYWHVGDVRTVSLSAMNNNIAPETHVAQTADFVLMDDGGKYLSTGEECVFIVGMRQCLKEKGKLDSESRYYGWDYSTERRSWCNNTFRDAMPSTLRGIFKIFANNTYKWDGTVERTSWDWFALPAAKEVTGETSRYYDSGLSQFEWYETAANRIKTVDGTTSEWWTRTPGSNNTGVYIATNGVSGEGSPIYSYGISPYGCI